ncbi:hypothetical protein [Actinomadura formosensis]|uniref:hypothetical protein n=1 Tax=Actinomadura formosensis TaxID=60706 RepID=UPI003D928A1C
MSATGPAAELAALHARAVRWQAGRAGLAAREEAGDVPHPSQWEAGDDEAAEIARGLAALDLAALVTAPRRPAHPGERPSIL